MASIFAQFVLATAVTAKTASKPTNFVVLFMDDNGWGDSAVNMAAEATGPTPAIQKMANEGEV